MTQKLGSIPPANPVAERIKAAVAAVRQGKPVNLLSYAIEGVAELERQHELLHRIARLRVGQISRLRDRG